MGSLNRFDIARYREHYGLSVLFETGTARGDGVREAIAAGFEHVYSVEIVEEIYRDCVDQFAGRHDVTLIHGQSRDALETALPAIEGSIMFWLDAHFPGADVGLSDYNAEPDEKIRCPLETELKVIRKHRPDGRDVLLMDDRWLYEDGDFENGNPPDAIRRPQGGLDFVDCLFGDTHHILRLTYDEGYLLLLPIDEPPKIHVRLRRFIDPTGPIGRLLTKSG